MRATEVPLCAACSRTARPNILMFGDYSWLHQRTREQENRFDAFLSDNRETPLVIIEIGAGSALPTIRNLSEQLGRLRQARVLRINPREPQIGAPHLSFAAGAVATLQQIETQLMT
jgi:NAD-dependent SIR2 family protein deacetylase